MKLKKLKTKKTSEDVDIVEDELNTKDLLEPLDADSSSEDEDTVDVKDSQLKLDNKVGSKTKGKKKEESVEGL